ADGAIEVQAAETLGHCADWLGIPTQCLRDSNRLSFDQSVIVSWRLKLDFSEFNVESFVVRRVVYHRALQTQFLNSFAFKAYRSSKCKPATCYSLWLCTNRICPYG
ncbi:MAG TPA: hypothetical protein VKB53_10435, partial [Gammaproteobacteria bacterium]|nr:hypothetical protein [Gammaproteobacteria bacterium]